jgi:hypothetical protein
MSPEDRRKANLDSLMSLMPQGITKKSRKELEGA